MTRMGGSHNAFLMWALLLLFVSLSSAFWTPASSSARRSLSSLAAANDMTPEEIKKELARYLEVRGEGAPSAPKVIGGTRGNVILDYVSGAPVKETVDDRTPNVFDYDELSNYGFANLVVPIMDLGGRRVAYELMGMDPPPVELSTRVDDDADDAPPVIIDRVGQDDANRYKGLRVLDDDAMGAALQAAQERKKRGESLRKKLVEEEYVPPFADRRNTGPKQTPVWTPEKLDEYGKARGKAESWVRRARAGEFVTDANESVLELSLPIRLYCVVTAALASVSFGRSTPSALERAGLDPDALAALQAPAAALALAAVASSVVCAGFLAPPKKRSSFVWAVKGFLGGPLAITQLRGLDVRVTREEQEGR